MQRGARAAKPRTPRRIVIHNAQKSGLKLSSLRVSVIEHVKDFVFADPKFIL
jgi:hypothetical protein